MLIAAVLLQVACGDTDGAQPAPMPTPLPVPAPVPAPAPTNVTVRGRVFDSTTNEAVGGITVILRRPDGPNVSTVTDGAGVFAFANVMTGDVTLRTASPDYPFNPTERQMIVTADTDVDLVVVPRRHTLTGRVTDIVTGSPLPDATVAVIDGLNASRSTTTGAGGTYTLRQLWFGGFTMRVRRPGYDSVFRGVNFGGDTNVDIQMRVAQQSLAGTWTGDMTRGGLTPLPIAEATLTHAGDTIASNFLSGAFVGRVADQSIGSTAQVTGTLIVRRTTGTPRIPTPCDGTGAFTGTVNWTRLVVSAPQVTYSCGGTDTSVTLSLVRQQ
jgi:hypothetical protein